MTLLRFDSDEDLVDRVRAGSAPAFEALFERHHRPLLGFCRHMLGSAADAEDAVQHTFMAAYADLMRSDKPIVLRPWLYSIARHRCVSVLRRRREQPLDLLPEPDARHLAAEIDVREELRATLTDIAHLPDDQRAALVLAELGDTSHAEIARILGCRHEKVKALVFQARSALATGRTARDMPCAEIREQLAIGGTGMRRTALRRHVRDCAGCREYGEQLRLQRRRLRVLWPVAPILAFKRAVLGAISLPGGAGAVTAAAVGTAGVGGLAATAVVSVAIAGGDGKPATATGAGPAWPAATAIARAERVPRRAARAATARAQRAPKPGRPLPAVAAPGREREPAGRPFRDDPAATSSPRGPVPEALAQPAEPSGHEQRATQPEPSSTPDPEPPGAGKPAAPPGAGKPAAPPGAGKPAAPPGAGRPPEPPGAGRPPEPPSGAPPEPGPPPGVPAGGREPHPEPGGPVGPATNASARAPGRR